MLLDVLFSRLVSLCRLFVLLVVIVFGLWIISFVFDGILIVLYVIRISDVVDVVILLMCFVILLLC